MSPIRQRIPSPPWPVNNGPRGAAAHAVLVHALTGLDCSQCGSPDVYVVDSRPRHDRKSIRRRRACARCGFRFTTYESVVSPDAAIKAAVLLRRRTSRLFQKIKTAVRAALDAEIRES